MLSDIWKGGEKKKKKEVLGLKAENQYIPLKTIQINQ